MINDKIAFNSDKHTNPEKLVIEKNFKVRVVVYNALVCYMTDMLDSCFDNDFSSMKILAQQLALVPVIKSGWKPTDQEVATISKNMVDCYFAHFTAFTKNYFPEPKQAAFDMLKKFDFAV